MPGAMLNPQFNGSFVRASGELLMQGRLAPGSRARIRGELQVRQARVFGIADLFWEFGDTFSAAELYGYYTTCRVVAMRRERGQRAWE